VRLADDERALSRVLLAPAILYIALLVGAPFVLAIVYSLTSISLGGHSFHFVGLQNFQAALRDPSFRRALGNTVLFAFVSQILVLVLASTLAIALQREFRGKWVVRLLILLPWVAPLSLGTIGWLWILDSIYSVINWTLRYLHIFGPPTWPIWLGQPTLAGVSIVTVQVWRTLPLATVIAVVEAGASAEPAGKEGVAALKQFRPSVGTAPQEFVQRASVVAWNDEEHVERTRAAYRRKREALLPTLARKGIRVAGSDATMYLWLEVPAGESSETFAGRLLEHGLIVSPGTPLGVPGQSLRQLSVATRLLGRSHAACCSRPRD